MFCLLLHLLLLLPPGPGETCDVQIQELRQEMINLQNRVKVELESKVNTLDFERKEAELRLGVAEVQANVPIAVSQALKDLPYLML